MAVSYNRLWKQLNDRGMRKRNLEREAGISHYTIYKLWNSLRTKSNHGKMDIIGGKT